MMRMSDKRFKNFQLWKNLDPSFFQTATFEDVRVCLKDGCAPNTGDDNKNRPLHLAIKSNMDFEIVALIIGYGADVNAFGESGRTPLHYAVQNKKSSKMVNLLISHGADVGACDDDGWTPLHYAADRDDAEIIKILVNAGADVNAGSNKGWTPLHCAVQSWKPEHDTYSAVEALLDAEADSSGGKEDPEEMPYNFLEEKERAYYEGLSRDALDIYERLTSF